MHDGPTVSRGRFCVTSAVVLNSLLGVSALMVGQAVNSETTQCEASTDDWCRLNASLAGLFFGAILFVLSVVLWCVALRGLRHRWRPEARDLWIVPLVTIGLLVLGAMVASSGIFDPKWPVAVATAMFAPTFATWLWLATRNPLAEDANRPAD